MGNKMYMEPTTTHGRYITEQLVGEWLEQFIIKSNDYGETSDDLGAAGQFADMNRKWGKLRRALWEGQELVGEQPREILMDMIGHCFLTIHYLDAAKRSERK